VELRQAGPDPRHTTVHATGGPPARLTRYEKQVFDRVAGKVGGERDTAAGRAVAARWLGVRDWLAAHESFADPPPAAVTVWDRYLPYGAALGVTRVAGQVIDLCSTP
jgi:hypothetical protein